MIDDVETGALRELIRQGERLLSAQEVAYDAALRRAGELLRLVVATLGGIIVIAGILAARGAEIESAALVAFAGGIGLLLGAGFLLSLVLAGDWRPGDLVYGPSIGHAVAMLDRPDMTENKLLRSILEAVPVWLEENHRVIRAIEKKRSWALVLLGLGTKMVVSALVYIVGGSMHA